MTHFAPTSGSNALRMLLAFSCLSALALAGLLVSEMPAAAMEQESVLAIGDRIKIIFLEVPDEKYADEGNDTLFVERGELTGEYLVQDGGMIDIPILGQTPAADHPLEFVKQHLHEKYKEMFGHNARVSMTLVGREPVYIVGPVARPGAYDYSPNLTVLHLIAKSGGPNDASTANWQLLEAIRERYKLQVSVARQQKLLALIAALEVEGTDQEPTVPPRLRQLAGEAAERILAETRALRATIVEARNVKLNSLEASLAASNELLRNKDERIRFMSANVESRQERMTILKGLSERGTSNGFNYSQAKSDWSDANDRLQEALGVRAQVEERTAQLEMEKKRTLLEARMDIERELSEAKDKLMEEERTAAASAHIANLAPDVFKLSDVSSVPLHYSIQRKADGTVTTFDASEVTPLRPGDLLVVKKDGSSTDPEIEKVSHSMPGERTLN